MRIVRAAAIAGFLALVSAVPASATPVCTDGYMGGPPADAVRRPDLPRGRARARRTSSTRPTRSASSSTSTASSTWRRSTRAGSRVFKLSDLYGDGRRQRRPGRAPLLRGRRHRRRARHPGDQDHRPQGPRQGQGDAAVLAVGPRQRARRPRGRPAHRRGPRDRRRGRRQDRRRRRQLRVLHRPQAGVPRVRGRATCSPRRPSTSSTSTSTAGPSATWWNPPLPTTYTRGNSIGTDLNRQMPTHRPHQPEPQPAPGERDELRHEVHARGRGARAGRQDGLRRRHPRRAQLAGLHGHHVPGRRVRLGRPPPADGDRRAHEVGDRRRRSTRASSTRSRTRAAATTPSTRARDPDQARALGDGLGHARLHRHRLHRRLHGHRARRHRHGLRDLPQPHGPGEDLERLPPGEPHQRQPGDHQDGDGVRAVPGRGVQRRRTSKVDPVGRAGYVVNPDTVTDTDENGPGTLPGPDEDGIGADGQPVEQRSYERHQPEVVHATTNR